MNIYDIVLGIALLIVGVFFGSILAHVIVYKLVHPYIGKPYFERRKNEMKR